MNLKTNYFGHDHAYQTKFEAGQDGWDSPAVYESFQTRMRELLKHADIQPYGHILELGCGAGNMSQWLKTIGFSKITGIDISERAIDRAKQRMPEDNFLCMDLCKSTDDLNSEQFEAAFDSHFLHCIVGTDRTKVLIEIHRLLKPGDLFFGETMCTPIEKEVANMIGYDKATGNCISKNGTATRFIGRPEYLIQELEDAGFEIVQCIEPEPEDGVGNLLFAGRKQ